MKRVALSGNAVLGVLVGVLFLAVIIQGALIYQMRSDESVTTERAAHETVYDRPDRGEVDRETVFDFPAFGDSTPDAWDPFEEMERMRRQMDRLFGDSLNRLRRGEQDFGRLRDWSFAPEMDLREEEDRYVIRFNISGADKADIDVNIKDRLLTVSGVTDQQLERKEEGRVLQSERRQGRFTRSITLPGPVDAGGMEARYEKGVLVVTVPKAEDITPSRRIHVT